MCLTDGVTMTTNCASHSRRAEFGAGKIAASAELQDRRLSRLQRKPCQIETSTKHCKERSAIRFFDSGDVRRDPLGQFCGARVNAIRPQRKMFGGAARRAVMPHQLRGAA